MDRIATLLIEHSRWFLGGVIALTLGAVLYLGLHGLDFDANIENFFPEGDPIIAEYRAFVDAYEADDGLLLVGFEHPDLFSPPVLADIAALTDSLEGLPNVDRVLSLTNVERLENSAEGIATRPFIESIPDDPEVLARLRDDILQDSLAVGFVVNAEADVTAFVVHLDTGDGGYEERERALEGLRRVLTSYEDRYAFRLTGIPYLRNTYVDALRIETGKYFLISSVLIVLLLSWMFRSVRGIVLPLLIVYLGVLWTVASMMLLDTPIDVLTSTLTAIILVVGVADSIHLLAKYYDVLAERRDRRFAIRQMVIRLGSATLLTSITTAIGFATLSTSNVVPMRRFGLFTALGVLLTFAVSVVVLSGVLLRTRMPRERSARRLTRGLIPRFLLRVDRFVAARPAWIVVGAALITALSILGATRLRVNAYVNDDLGPATRAYQDMMFFQNRIVAPFPFEVLIRAPEPDAFKDPALLRQAVAVEAYLEGRPEVKRVASINDVLASLNRVMHGDSAAYQRLPDDPALVSEYLFLLDLTDPDLLARSVDFEYREVRLTALMDDIGSYRMKRFMADLDSVLASTLDPELEVTRTGTIILAVGIADYLTESLLFSIALAVVFISVLMGVLFRTLRLVVISLVPNLLPLVLTAGVMGFLAIDIKPATAVIFSIAFGIAVDDTIHMLARLRQESADGRPLRSAIRRTILGTGKAVILTSIILFGGFSVLTTSSFQSSMYMGLLVSFTILAALLADLLLLPALLHLWKPDLSPLSRTPSNPADTPQPLA